MSSAQHPSSSNSSTTSEHQFNSLKDVNNVVQSILLKIAKQHQYTNPAVVQEELLQKYPNVQEYLKKARLNVGNIPRLNEHSRLIQHVNLKILVYALIGSKGGILLCRSRGTLAMLGCKGNAEKIHCTDRDTHSTQTHAVSQEVSPNDYHLLGPVTKLPVVLEIFKVEQFAECVEKAFTVLKCNKSHISQMRMSAEDIRRKFGCHKIAPPPPPRKGAHRSFCLKNQRISSFVKYMQVLFNENVSSQNKNDGFEALFKFGIRIKRISQPMVLQRKKAGENILRESTAAQEKIRSRVTEIWSTVQDCSKKTYLG
ncbi:unnamed protein product [Trichobilharzia regenti]|nr:unnamed protein product [Trichobilharzia regenti]